MRARAISVGDRIAARFVIAAGVGTAIALASYSLRPPALGTLWLVASASALLGLARFFGRGPALLAAIVALLGGVAPFATDLARARIGFGEWLALLGWSGMVLLLAKPLRSAGGAEWSAGEELRLLMEGATDYALFLADADGRVTTWSGAAERIFGWTEAQILGQPSAVLYGGDDAEAVAAAALMRAQSEGRHAQEAWQLRRNRSEFLADVRITALRTGDGRSRGFAIVVHDVTESRAAARALENRERHLRSILATVPDGMIVIDERGSIISFSAAAERLFGYQEADMLGENVCVLMPEPDRDRHDAYLRRYLETGEAHVIGIGRVVSGRRADGSVFLMKLSVGEALSGDQRLFTGFVQDLTERREFEAKLAEAKAELIHVSRLSAMGTMASTLAHELNQPLTAMASYAEAAEGMIENGSSLDRESLREIFTEVSAQALRAGDIVRRLREFVSRGEIVKTVEDLPALINEASALALVGTRDSGITTRFRFAPDATPVLADRVQVQQVLINLIRNGVEAMTDAPEKTLTIGTRRVGADRVEIRVADTGPGVPEGMRPTLFEAFHSSKKGGMGLGLSICRTIVEAHGGRIGVELGAGGGSKFHFTLLHPGPERLE